MPPLVLALAAPFAQAIASRIAGPEIGVVVGETIRAGGADKAVIGGIAGAAAGAQAAADVFGGIVGWAVEAPSVLAFVSSVGHFAGWDPTSVHHATVIASGLLAAIPAAATFVGSVAAGFALVWRTPNRGAEAPPAG